MTRAEAKNKLNNMSPEELLLWKKKKGYDTCPRCGGSGKYSYNTMYGDTCFKCNGLGFAPLTKKEIARRNKEGWK